MRRYRWTAPVPASIPGATGVGMSNDGITDLLGDAALRPRRGLLRDLDPRRAAIEAQHEAAEIPMTDITEAVAERVHERRQEATRDRSKPSNSGFDPTAPRRG